MFLRITGSLFAILVFVATSLASAGEAYDIVTPEQKAAADALKACKLDAPPEKLYGVFNEFCKTHFGAEHEPLVYEHSGKKLSLLEKGAWIHASLTSAAVGFETNIPSLGHVEYGETNAYGKKTAVHERHFYLHLHYLKGLTPGKVYHYRVVATDERGNKITGKDQTFTTRASDGAVLVPGTMQGPPYILDQSKATYILTKDLVTSGDAIKIVGDDITLDLNGYTVLFGKGATGNCYGVQACGSTKTRTKYISSGVKLLNGTIKQSDGPALKANKNSYHFNCFSIKGADTVVAGVTIDYHAPQAWGALITHPSGNIVLHHNIFVDRGGIIKNRHGAASRTFGFQHKKREVNHFLLHHNLVKRTRQNGIGGAGSMHNNEVYVDSCSTNSFAMQPNSVPGVKAGEHHHNRIFATGFNPYGFGWAHEDLRIHHNLIHFQGLNMNKRWHENWGDMSMLEGMRVTNYGKGGQVRNNLQYWKNLIVIKGREGCEMRGTGFFSDVSIKNLVFRDNVVKVISQDAKTTQAACIVAHGHTKKPKSNPVFYRNNVLLSNICNIRFGDSYGKGHNHYFENNQIIRVGKHKFYHTLALGGAYTTSGHRVIDSVFKGGARPDSVFWQRTGGTSCYAIMWTTTVKTAPGAAVVIKDKNGKEVLKGEADAKGLLAVPLTEYVIRPAFWPKGGEAKNRSDCAKEILSPYTITVSKDGKNSSKQITVKEKSSVDINL